MRNPPAFARTETGFHDGHEGMSLRDYFAAKAMQGHVAHCGLGSIEDEKASLWAYDLADAMLDARQEE